MTRVATKIAPSSSVGSSRARPWRRLPQALAARVGRLIHHEYWPTWVLYVPVVLQNIGLGLRHGGFMTPSCCNPEFGKSGGMAGESKAHIFELLGADRDPRVLPIRLIPAGEGASARAERVIALVRAESALGGYPVILKPDSGERGHAVKIARGDDEVHAYFATMTADAIVQRYHPGPMECGVMWVRTQRRDDDARPSGGAAPTDRHEGEVFAITDKVFPFVEGDGRRTLEDLIWDHPRYRRQAGVFLARFAGQLSRVPIRGERVQLAQSGNHCQGVLFRDGEHLRSPALESAINALASAFPRLDVGRFDIRYESVEKLQRGEFGVVELNGTASEPTNIYDPDRSVWWAWSVMLRLWRRLYVLGEARRREGVPPSRLRTLLHETRAHFRSRRGPAISD
jgi:hypothetical protein